METKRFCPVIDRSSNAGSVDVNVVVQDVKDGGIPVVSLLLTVFAEVCDPHDNERAEWNNWSLFALEDNFIFVPFSGATVVVIDQMQSFATFADRSPAAVFMVSAHF